MFYKFNLNLKLIVVAFVIAILYIYIDREIYGETFVNEIRLADRDNALSVLPDDELIQLGREVCFKSSNWDSFEDSNKDIAREIAKALVSMGDNTLLVETSSIITFLRYQSIYELCPENISILSRLIEQDQNSD
tara:strand:+ start:225 stop:626 length:402 start_codon:yes stop_codon:yes gene_type:complete